MAVATELTQQVTDVKLFNRWTFEDVQVLNLSLTLFDPIYTCNALMSKVLVSFMVNLQCFC